MSGTAKRVTMAGRVRGMHSGAGGRSTVGLQSAEHARTILYFTDGSALCVYWDGGHEVAGLHGGSDMITLYCPGSTRYHIPVCQVEMIEHKEGSDR